MGQLTGIHYADAMNILYWSFKAFQILYKHFGCFAPDPKMIGFLSDGQVKVWANPKYSKPSPRPCYDMLDEGKFIQRIVEIFSSKVNRETLPVATRSKGKIDFKPTTFDEAITEL